MGMDPHIGIHVLGELQIRRSGNLCELPPSRKTRALLAYLAVTGRPHRREKLCEMFWELPDDPRGSLRWSLSKIRSVIRTGDEDPLDADRNTVLLRPGTYALDYSEIANLGPAQFERLDTPRLRRIAETLRGRFMEDLAMANCMAFEAWRVSHADAVDIAARRLYRTLVDRLRDSPEEALPYLHALQQIDPEDPALASEAEVLTNALRQNLRGMAVRFLAADPRRDTRQFQSLASAPDRSRSSGTGQCQTTANQILSGQRRRPPRLRNIRRRTSPGQDRALDVSLELRSRESNLAPLGKGAREFLFPAPL